MAMTNSERAKEFTGCQQAMADHMPFKPGIMELTVPGGKEAVRELRKLDPDAKVIVANGYADNPVMVAYAIRRLYRPGQKTLFLAGLNIVVLRILEDRSA